MLVRKETTNGITLIALIITIIVMLILVAVAVRTAVDSNLFGHAKNATKKWAEAQKNEANIGNDNYIKDIVNQYNGGNPSDPEDTNVVAKHVKVGDYIAYGEKLEVEEYLTDIEETGYTESQTFQTDKTTAWRVMYIKENGEVEIVTTTNTLTDGGNTGLYLCGRKGFLNAKTVLNDMCQKLYTSEYGVARTITAKDINQLSGHMPSEPNVFTYTTGWEYYDEKIGEFRIPSEENPVEVTANTYSYAVNNQTPLYDTLMANTFCPDGDFNVKSNVTEHYWLPDMATFCTETYANSGLRNVRGRTGRCEPIDCKLHRW